MSLVIIGPLPPPTTGRSVVTAQLLKELEQTSTSYLLVNLAVRWTIGPVRRRLRRVGYLARSAGHVFRQTRQAAITYIAVDSNPGTLFTALYALIARVTGTRIVLHHHSYSYIQKSSFSMLLLSWAAGRGALHATPCAVASAELEARYTRVEHTAVLTNAFAVDPDLAAVRRPRQRDRLVLGHLSNLTVAKGVLTVLACFAELHRRGEPVELHLAGPSMMMGWNGQSIALKLSLARLSSTTARLTQPANGPSMPPSISSFSRLPSETRSNRSSRWKRSPPAFRRSRSVAPASLRCSRGVPGWWCHAIPISAPRQCHRSWCGVVIVPCSQRRALPPENGSSSCTASHSPSSEPWSASSQASGAISALPRLPRSDAAP